MKQPWTIAKDPGRTDELHAALGQHIGTARTIATAAEPIVPSLAQRLRHQLGDGATRLPEPTPVFQRLEPVAAR